MLAAHLDNHERILLAFSEIAQQAGNTNLRGGPREWFVREFLREHLPTTVEIGQGEIIDRNSRPNPSRDAQRPQVDVVVYRSDLPRIPFGQGSAAFLVEGVLATMEIKSRLTFDGLLRACDAA